MENRLQDRRPGRLAAAILVAGFGVMLALNAPGQLSYDSVTQLADGRAGHYNSWHPPLMAFLLGVFDSLVPGTFLFLLFQSLLLLGGMLALLALRPRGWPSAVLALLIVLTPQWLLYQGEIWKDILFAAAGIAGFAALAWYARRSHPAPLILAAVLLAAAAAIRQNGIILLPVAAVTLALTGPGRWKHGLGFLAAGLVLLLGIGVGLASHTDGGDGAAAEVRLAQSYDMAGAFARDPQLVLPLPPEMERLLKGRGARLYTPLRNDDFAADPDLNRVRSDAPAGVISGAWQALVLHHAGLYLSVRWNDSVAVLTTPDTQVCHFVWTGIYGEADVMRRLGLSARHRIQDQLVGGYAHLLVGTPVFSHVAWGLLAIVLLILLLRRRKPADLAVAGLLAGALLFALSFFFLSIACDYRYMVFLDFAAMAAALHAVARQKPTQKNDQFFGSSGSVFPVEPFSHGSSEKKKMRACFLGQNVCALGFGVATLQTPPMMAEPASNLDPMTGIVPGVTPIRPENDISTGLVDRVHPSTPALDVLPHAPLA